MDNGTLTYEFTSWYRDPSGMRRLFDRDADGVVERHELPAWEEDENVNRSAKSIRSQLARREPVLDGLDPVAIDARGFGIFGLVGPLASPEPVALRVNATVRFLPGPGPNHTFGFGGVTYQSDNATFVLHVAAPWLIVDAQGVPVACLDKSLRQVTFDVPGGRWAEKAWQAEFKLAQGGTFEGEVRTDHRDALAGAPALALAICGLVLVASRRRRTS